MTNRIKVGVHLPNKKIAGVRLHDPRLGNPGIGGTQFLLFSLPFYLNEYFPSEFEFLLLAESTKNLKTEFQTVEVSDLSDAAEKAKDAACDMIIFRPNSDKETIAFLKKIEALKLPSIAWMHNSNRLILNNLSSNKFVLRCVCLSYDQYETLRDHPLIKKTAIIYNAVDPVCFPEKSSEKEKNVVFIGSLTFAKGFHTIARMWKKIIKIHPDAKLIVIGSGKLYDRASTSGELNIAEQEYENLFRKFISDEKNQILDSVRFLGVMGQGKYEIMSKAAVGIVTNPLLRETFCLSAVEFQLCGTPAVSRGYGGLLDTVKDGKGGFLRNSQTNRLKCILKLLDDLELSKTMGLEGRQFVLEKFTWEKIAPRWIQLIKDVQSKAEVDILAIEAKNINLLNNYRENMRLMKEKFPLFRVIIPSIYLIQIIEFLRLKWQKYLYKYF